MIALTVRCFKPWFDIAHRYEVFSTVRETRDLRQHSQSVDLVASRSTRETEYSSLKMSGSFRQHFHLPFYRVPKVNNSRHQEIRIHQHIGIVEIPCSKVDKEKIREVRSKVVADCPSRKVEKFRHTYHE